MAKKQSSGSIQAKRMAKAMGDQQEPGHGAGSVFKKSGHASETDNLPRVGQKTYLKDTEKDPEINIIVPRIAVVNQRIFCIPVASTMKQDEATGLWKPVPTTMADKAGNVKELPRFFVAKHAPDIFIETKDGTIHVEMPTGTEVFPFWPDHEDWSFPKVYDPDSGIHYTVLHWTELSAYLIPDKELEVKK